jgi:hypothetical protein
MNKRQILASLSNIANQLDIDSLYQEANILTEIMVKIAQEEDPGQDDPGQEDLKPENPEIQKEYERLTGEERNIYVSLFKKRNNANDLDSLYKLKEEILNANMNTDHIVELTKNVDDRIANLEKATLEKYQYMVSKPYFETNLVNFTNVGKQIENDPNFKNLHEKTKEKIRLYYSNLSGKIKTRNQERPNEPLQNLSKMKGNPDAIVNFISKNLQYETNKILSPKTLYPMMQDYLQNFSEFENLSEAERKRTLQFVMDKYKVDVYEARKISEDLKNPKNMGVLNLIKTEEIENIIFEMGEIYKNMTEIASGILTNAKKFAATGNASDIIPLDELPTRSSNFAPNRTLYNLLYSIHQNYYDLSKSVSAAENLKKNIDSLFQKVKTSISVIDFENLNDQFDMLKPFDLPRDLEDMEEQRKLYTPLYPGSRPPEQ